jgi:PKD repeat protein/glucose/arabinose dehydrogenase
LALVLPATASAKEVEPYKVLVVTSTSDELSTAGISAITSAVGADGVVEAPAPAAVGAKFTAEGLDAYRTVVFLNTGQASPLNDTQRSAFEAYYKKGGGFVGVGSAIETDSSWAFLTDLLGTRSSGRTAAQAATVKVIDRVHDASKNLSQYWDRTEAYYNFAANVRGKSHVLASVVEDPFGKQPQGKELNGIEGGTMGADHPVAWCKDFSAGRSFYTALGTTAAAFDADLNKHLKGAIAWSAGQSDPAYSDCGATVLSNYQQTKIASPPNVGEPIGFHRLDDGRIIQTLRSGQVRVHNPATGTTDTIGDFQAASTPSRFRLYSVSEDGLYGPAVDKNFAQNRYLYLYYSPLTVTDVKLSTGQVVTQTTPIANAPNTPQPTVAAWDPWVGYFQLSRFKLTEDANGKLSLDFNSEEQIMRVAQNRGSCCHVGGDIVFDSSNNLITGTGDDNEAGGVNGGGYGPFNDQYADEYQLVRTVGATGGTFTLTFEGETTAPIPYNATYQQVDAALEALNVLAPNEVQTNGGAANATTSTNAIPFLGVHFRRARSQKNQPQLVLNGAGLEGPATPSVTTSADGGWPLPPISDARRSAGNTNDLRGKILRIKPKETAIPAADFNKADYGSGSGAYSIPAGNLFPLVAGAPQAKTRPEVHSMGFRNPFRVDVDSDGVIYTSDYSPDANGNSRGRGPSGVGRYEILRKPSNYGWPTCYSSKLGYWEWEFNEFSTAVNAQGQPLVGILPLTGPKAIECGGPTQKNDSWWNLQGGPSVEPGLEDVPPVTDPDVWYSYQDNPNTGNRPVGIGTPCQAYTNPTVGTPAPGSSTECPRLFPELFTGGVAPHGMSKYEYDPANPSTVKFPPYYDDSVIIGEFGQNTLREMKLDGDNHIQKINNFLDCGQVNPLNPPMFECDAPMDMAFGTDGAFYLLTYGNGFFTANFDAGMYKWEYVKGARAPKAVLTTDKTSGGVPLTVNFSSAGSLDQDPGDSIRYEWDFGDGSPISEEANPTHTYTAAGSYTAVLSVIDSTGKRTSTSTIITAGNNAPTITITTPIEGGTFQFGDKIPYVVEVTDAEDKVIDCQDVEVEFILGHDEHGHGEEEKLGCNGFLQTLSEDVSHGGNVFGVVSAVYTDRGNGAAPGITVTKQVKIRQRQQQVEHATFTNGVLATATNDTGGGLHMTSLGTADFIRLNGPFNLTNISGITVRYADAAAGRPVGGALGNVVLRTGSQTGPIVGTFPLTNTGSPSTAEPAWNSLTFPLTLAGTNELFLTFSANNAILLNWVQFEGEGITVVKSPPVEGPVGGTVPATLSLSLGAPASFGAFTPGIAKEYTASTEANVISTAGDATLSVTDPSPTNTGKLVNGAFALAQPLQGLGVVKTWTAPTTNEKVPVTFKQAIGANDPLRTGSYSKTLTFTLSTTTP